MTLEKIASDIKRMRTDYWSQPLPTEGGSIWKGEIALVEINDFKEALLKSYDLKQRTVIFNIKNLFIPAKELRKDVTKSLGITKEEFNKHLTHLLDSDYNIKLHGAPTHVYAKEKRPFEYQGKALS